MSKRMEQKVQPSRPQGSAPAVMRKCRVPSARRKTDAGERPRAAASPRVEELVPAAFKSKGTLTVAADASYAPERVHRRPTATPWSGWTPT